MVDRLFGGTSALGEQLPSYGYVIKDIKCNVLTGHIVTLKNRLREHELVLVALLVFCASLGS